MITVRALADEIGVSKVAVNKKIETLGIKSELVKDGNRYLLTDEVADKVRDAFKYRTTEKTTEKTASNKQTETPGGDPGTYADIIQVLREQLAEKDKQIAELHTLLAQQNQLMLTDGSTRSQGTTQEVQAETIDQEDAPAPHQEERKSFWSRLFG